MPRPRLLALVTALSCSFLLTAPVPAQGRPAAKPVGPPPVSPPPPSKPGPVQPAADVDPELQVLWTEHSVYIPCYAFTVLTRRDDAELERNLCHARPGPPLVFAAAVPFLETRGRGALTRVACDFQRFGDDEFKYAVVMYEDDLAWGFVDARGKLAARGSGDGSAVRVEAYPRAKARPLDTFEHVYHLEVATIWRVAAGEGYLPGANGFRGCRVEYRIMR